MKKSLFLRQMLLLGIDNQKKLNDKTILLVGIGGLGSPVALYLSRLGIKKLILVDFDIVEESNLSRQILYDYSDLNNFKINSAKKKLNGFSEIEISKTYNDDLIKKSDLILSLVDNWKTRYDLNKKCMQYNKMFVDVSVEGFGGHILWIDNRNCIEAIKTKFQKTKYKSKKLNLKTEYLKKEQNLSVCLECIFSKKITKKPIPVVNTACIFAASIILSQILNYFIENIYPKNKLVYFDSKEQKIEFFKVKKNKNCFCSKF